MTTDLEKIANQNRIKRTAPSATRYAGSKGEIAANIEKLLAEARNQNAQAQFNEYTAAERKIELAQSMRVEEYNLASLKNQRIYNFFDAVGDMTVAPAMATLDLLANKKTAPIEIRIQSPGGNVVAGMSLFDHIQSIRRRGIHVTTVAYGMAASMGGILLQAGDTRIMCRESFLLIHEISTAAVGKVGEMDDELKLVHKMCDRVVDIFVERSAGKISKASFKREWARKDWWLDALEALKYGFIDEVR
jgi:ATP-dependent Clp endopeptidase proteolytic subunit ClpP